MWSIVVKWLALVALGLVLAQYYNPGLLRRILPQDIPLPSETVTSLPRSMEKKPKTKKHNTKPEQQDTKTSSTETAVSKKRKIANPGDVKTIPVETQKSVEAPSKDTDLSNKEFAQQLAKAQSGTQFGQVGGRQLSKKERRAAKAAAPKVSTINTPPSSDSADLLTDTSSGTGRATDDDLSSHDTASLERAAVAPSGGSRDVSDMLEAPASKPMTLRLTDIKESSNKPRTAPKAFEPVLNKKQRRRKAENEINRINREESERMQEAKKQAHLRAARMAEGTSNQTKANAFTSATQHAWQTPNPATKAAPPQDAQINGAPLLDTFEPSDKNMPGPGSAVTEKSITDITDSPAAESNVNAVKAEVGSKKTEAMAASSREQQDPKSTPSKNHSSWANEVNEEEQNKWANDLVKEEQWESVTSKKAKKRAGKKDGDTSSEASSAAIPAKPNQPAKAILNGTNVNGIGNKYGSVNRFQAVQSPKRSGLEDADWEP